MSSTDQQGIDWTLIRRTSIPDVRGQSAEGHDRLHVDAELGRDPVAIALGERACDAASGVVHHCPLGDLTFLSNNLADAP